MQAVFWLLQLDDTNGVVCQLRRNNHPKAFAQTQTFESLNLYAHLVLLNQNNNVFHVQQVSMLS